MKQIRVYQTRDNTTFTDRVPAEKHELMLNIRSIIQSHVRGESFSPTDLAKLVVAKQDEVFGVISKHRKTMASIKGAATRLL